MSAIRPVLRAGLGLSPTQAHRVGLELSVLGGFEEALEVAGGGRLIKVEGCVGLEATGRYRAEEGGVLEAQWAARVG